jgi:hypothetical protein
MEYSAAQAEVHMTACILLAQQSLQAGNSMIYQCSRTVEGSLPVQQEEAQ